MDKYKLVNKIKNLDGITDEEKLDILNLIRQNKNFLF